MELVGKLKNQIEQTDNKKEVRSFIENASVKLSDDDLEMVSGGVGGKVRCPRCGKAQRYCGCS